MLCVVAGAATGYLLWIAYYDAGLVPLRLILSLIEGVKSLVPWLGAETTKKLTIILVVVVQALPAALVLGVIVGLILPRLNARRWLCYSVLAWPLIAYLTSAIVLMAMERNTSPELLQPLWDRRGKNVLVGFVIYSLFFVSVFLANAFFNAAKAHGRPMQPTARSGG